MTRSSFVGYWLVFIGLVMLLYVSCDPGLGVVYDNQTDQAVDIFIDGSFSASVEPQSSPKFELIEFEEAMFEARTSEGAVIYRRTFTWDQLKDAGWRIIITGSPEPS